MQSMQVKWDTIYREREVLPTAALVLQQNQHLLPQQGVALELACGQGGNALLLAGMGLDVSAYDVSAVAIEQLRQAASSKSLRVDAQVRDIIESPPERNSVDVLVVITVCKPA